MIRRPPRSTLSLHDALPISDRGECSRENILSESGVLSLFCHIRQPHLRYCLWMKSLAGRRNCKRPAVMSRSEEHTSELQSHSDLVCRLLLEKKKIIQNNMRIVLEIVLSVIPEMDNQSSHRFKGNIGMTFVTR